MKKIYYSIIIMCTSGFIFLSIALYNRAQQHLNCPYNSRPACEVSNRQYNDFFSCLLDTSYDSETQEDYYNNLLSKPMTDKWGNTVIVITEENSVTLRSLGENGIDDKGEIDDISISCDVDANGSPYNIKKNISGQTKLRYWSYFPFSHKEAHGRIGSFAFWELLFMILKEPT